MASVRVYQVRGFGWAAWKWIAPLPGQGVSFMLSKSYGTRIDAEAEVRHLRWWG